MSRINLTPSDLWKGLLKKRLIVGGVFLVVFMISGIGYYTSQPASCKLCHYAETSSWQSGHHNAVKCNRCHDSIAPVNFFKRSGEYLSFVFHLYEAPIKTRVKNSRCLGCHNKDDLKRKSPLTPLYRKGEEITENSPLFKRGEEGGIYKRDIGRIKISHSGISGGEFYCTDCHKSSAHEVDAKAVGEPVLMGVCLDCHQKQFAALSGECGTCHENPTEASARWEAQSTKKNGTLWQSLHGNDPATSHGKKFRNSCGFCHTNEECSKCHGGVYPHYELWLNYHSAYKKGCTVCHRKGFCLSCHGVEMPHPLRWDVSHGKSTRNRAVCYKCHSSSDCDNCHFKHLHPQVPGVKMNQRIYGD